MSVPALVDQGSFYCFAIGDRVRRTYPVALLARIGTPDTTVGTVTSTGRWITVSWDSGKTSLVNPAYLARS